MIDLLTPASETAVTAPTGPVVIGLDTALGSAGSTGTGIASSHGWCEAVGWEQRKKNPITTLPHPLRLIALTGLKTQITLQIGAPDLIVMETPAPSRAGGGSHERAWLWWELYRWATASGIPVALMTPNQRALYATGKGNAGKSAVVDAQARRWPAWQTGGDDNLADAVVLMAAGRDRFGHPVGQVPQANRSVLDRIEWPELSP